MYVREIEGKETSLGVSGALWRDALVMIDRDSGSFWSQIDGRAILGAHEGKRLREMPSRMTTWGAWKAEFPHTRVLETEGEVPDASRYERYFEDAERLGVLGTANPDDRLPGKTLVMGVRVGRETAAVPLDVVSDHGAAAFEIAGRPLWLVSLGDDDAALWLARAGERDLAFSRDAGGGWRDDQTGSVWDPAAGTATDGPLAGKALERVPARRVYWFVWARFNPDTALPLGAPAAD